MAEALTLLGLVANILQFVELGHTILSSAKEVYEDGKGLTSQMRHVQLLLEDIRNTRDGIEKRLANTTPLSLSNDEIAIQNYSTECDAIAARLGEMLEKLRVRDGAKSRRLESLRVSVYSMARKSEVQRLVEQLEDLDRRLRMRLQKVLDKEAAEREAHDQEDMENITITGFSSVVVMIDGLDKMNQRLGLQMGQAFDTLRLQLLQEIRSNSATLSRSVLELTENAKRTDDHQKLLQSLLFAEIKQRYSDIEEAHKQTLRWLYEDGITRFPRWLQSSSDLFWVTGLAGSGKSTLMKYVSGHPETRGMLRCWAQDKKLVLGSFYFWNQGTRMQKSLQGLMQSLLFQIARSDAHLARTLCSNRPHVPEPWTLEELHDVFRHLPDLVTTSKFCFFIDGLDEYDGQEKDVISFVKQLAACSSIKVCASSRPWNRFQEAFKASADTLVLEDLTRADITHYVQSELEQSEALQRSVALDPRCGSIVERVVERAEGVFLWVFLVVRSLRRDMQSEETFEHLQRRIDALPPTLNQWFRRIFETIDPIYRMETARLLLITLFLEDNDLAPLPLVAYECLETEIRTSSYAVDSSRDPPTPTALSNLANAQRIAAVRLNDRCRDLIQPRLNSNYKANTVHRVHFSFLHRTVRDFLREHYIEPLHEKAGNYSPVQSLTRVYLSLFHRYPTELFWTVDKVNPAYASRSPWDANANSSSLFLGDTAVKRANTQSHRLTRILMQFWGLVCAHEAEVEDEILDAFAAAVAKRHGSHWTNFIVPKGVAPLLRLGDDAKMLAWAVYIGLTSYLRRNWEGAASARIFNEYCLSPLALALEPEDRFRIGSVNDGTSNPPLPLGASTVQVLLEGGCDPNFNKAGYDFLVYLGTHSHKQIVERLGDMEDVYQVTKLLFQHGLRIPSVSRDVYQANFASTFEPLFGAARVNELWTLHQHAQRNYGWKAKFTMIFGFG